MVSTNTRNCKKRRRKSKRSQQMDKLDIYGLVDDYVKYPFTSIDQLLNLSLREFVLRYVNRERLISRFARADFQLIAEIGLPFSNRATIILTLWKSESFAVFKAIEKTKLLNGRLLVDAKKEMRMLRSIDYPFIVPAYLVQDNCYIYHVMPFACQADLHWLLSTVGFMTEDQARFYTSQVLLALEFLHCLGASHGNIKANHVLIFHDGYAKLTSLSSINLNVENPVEDYIAFGNLIWSLCHRSLDIDEAYPEVKNVESGSLLDLVIQLGRGNLGKYCTAQIRTHGWFQPVPWTKLINKAVPPPYELYEKHDCWQDPLRQIRDPRIPYLISKKLDPNSILFENY